MPLPRILAIVLPAFASCPPLTWLRGDRGNTHVPTISITTQAHSEAANAIQGLDPSPSASPGSFSRAADSRIPRAMLTWYHATTLARYRGRTQWTWYNATMGQMQPTAIFCCVCLFCFV